jgi:hypothetical protein
MKRTIALVAALMTLMQADAEPPVPDSASGSAITEATIFLIAKGDQGKIGRAAGCGDSLVPVKHAVAPSANRLRVTVEMLLSTPAQQGSSPPLCNTLHRSMLSIDDAWITQGVATLRLLGDVELNDGCDQLRANAQIVETLRQLGAIKGANVFVNGRPFSEAAASVR